MRFHILGSWEKRVSSTKRRICNPSVPLVIAVFTACASPLCARADTATWASAVSGNWTDSSNWLPTVVPNNNTPPGTNYDVLINATGAAYTVTLSAPVTINNLTLNSDTATLLLQSGGTTPQLTVAGELNLEAGLLTASGSSLTVGTLTGSGAIDFDGNASNNLLTTPTIGANILVRTGASGGSITTSAQSSVINNGTISAETSRQTITFPGTNVTNNGLLEVKNGATIDLNGSVNPNGLNNIFVNNNQMSITGSAVTFLVPSPYSGSFSNAGTITLNNGTLTLDPIGGNYSFFSIPGVISVQKQLDTCIAFYLHFAPGSLTISNSTIEVSFPISTSSSRSLAIPFILSLIPSSIWPMPRLNSFRERRHLSLSTGVWSRTARLRLRVGLCADHPTGAFLQRNFQHFVGGF